MTIAEKRKQKSIRKLKRRKIDYYRLIFCIFKFGSVNSETCLLCRSCGKLANQTFYFAEKTIAVSIFHCLTLRYVELRRRCVLQDWLANLLYCRYNAVPGGKNCVKCKYRTFDFSNSLPLALRRQGFGGHDFSCEAVFAPFQGTKKAAH